MSAATAQDSGDQCDRTSGIVSILTRRSVDETVNALTRAIEAKGARRFALIDHSGEARAAGLEMRPTKVLVFGDPRAGTALMIAAPSIALDLPLKLLVAEDDDGRVWISYTAPLRLQHRHSLPDDLIRPLGAVEALALAVRE